VPLIPETKAAYSAVRDDGAGLIDLSSRGRILVTGSEAVMFLNGLITNDVKTLPLDSWLTAAFANVQGRLLAVVRILHRRDGFLIDTENVTREKVVRLLDRFTLAGDFHVTDLSAQTATASVQGSKAADVVGRITGDQVHGLSRRQVLTVPFAGSDLTIIRATHSAADGFDLFFDAALKQQIHELLLEAGATPVNPAIEETLRIEAGILSYGVDMDETTIVTETNLDDAVSFTKGCYLGQEIIVRIKHRGHVAKKLVGVVLESDQELSRDAKILSGDEKEIGRVTSSTFSPRLGRTIGLSYVKYDYTSPGTEIKVVTSEGEVRGVVSQLPFVRGGW
jgi:folate-binding protein YgfZ